MTKIIRCKNCKYQRKTFYKDRRFKEGGYYIYGCEFISDPFTGSPVSGLDDEFCSRAEEKEKDSSNGEVDQAADPRINPFYGFA